MVFLVASPDEEDALPCYAAHRHNTHHSFREEYQPKTTPFIVTSVRHLLLEAILQLKLLNAEQLTRRYYKAGSLVTVKNRLTVLTREHYVGFLTLPTTEGNGPYLYFLARNGRDYFQELEEDVKDFYRPSKEKEKHYF